MQYAALGHTGVQVSRLCLGMMSYGSPEWQRWTLPYEAAEHFVRRALEIGINIFDTADFYSYGVSEEILGLALKKLARRSDVVVCTKVGLPMGKGVNDQGLSRLHILRALDASLRRLQTDHVDIYMIHDEDPRTPIEETIDVMADVVRSGRASYVGFSNLPAWKAAKAVFHGRYVARTMPRVAQIQYNLCFREDERDLLPLCASEGLGVMVYSPLARGWLAGNRAISNDVGERDAVRAESDAKAHALYGSTHDKTILEATRKVAVRHGVPPARIAMAWVLSRPAVSTMLCGVLEDSHLDEAVAAMSLVLSDEDVEELEGGYSAQALKSTSTAIAVSGTTR
jgi:aryl-alcohol dehydrogenase-like predicted oxidoreductase